MIKEMQQMIVVMLAHLEFLCVNGSGGPQNIGKIAGPCNQKSITMSQRVDK